MIPCVIDQVQGRCNLLCLDFGPAKAGLRVRKISGVRG